MHSKAMRSNAARASDRTCIEGGYVIRQSLFANKRAAENDNNKGLSICKCKHGDFGSSGSEQGSLENEVSRSTRPSPALAAVPKYPRVQNKRARVASDDLATAQTALLEPILESAGEPRRRSSTFPASRQRGFRQISYTTSSPRLSRSQARDPAREVAFETSEIHRRSYREVLPSQTVIDSVESNVHVVSEPTDQDLSLDRTPVTGDFPVPSSIPDPEQHSEEVKAALSVVQSYALIAAKQFPAARSPVISRNDMAAGFQRMSGDARRYPSAGFNRSENRPPMNNVLCRNGPQCRKFQEGGYVFYPDDSDIGSRLSGTCSYNHDFSAVSANGLNVAKKSLNVESPAFTPNFTPKAANAQPVKMGISPKAAAAAAFTPRGSGSVTPAAGLHSKEPSGEFIPQQVLHSSQQFSEFVPGQSFIIQQIEPQTSLHSQISAFGDPFMSQQGIANLDGQAQLNPYVGQTSTVSGQQFYQDASAYKHPLSYHLYASVGPQRENLMAYQRNTSDFFIPDNLREDLQRKTEATLQTFANSTLPQSVEYFHSLVALDTNNQKGPSTFGHPSWVYKATSSRDGHTYALRRIEGFRLTNEAAIRTVQNWKRISNSSLVQVHDAFTGRWFNDSSLIIVTDYHPTAQTLADKYFAVGRHAGGSRSTQIIPENDLWTYIVELASAMRAIHEGGCAAQTLLPSKVLVTSKSRLRLNGCGVLDIVQYEQRRPVTELQRSDLESLGQLMLGLATRNQTAYHTVPKSLDLVSRSYTERLRACLAWLLTPPTAPQDVTQADPQQMSEYNINTLLNNIADKVVSAFDSSLHLEDELTSQFTRELENGRLVRLLTKLNVILERPESSSSSGAQPSNPNVLNQSSTAWSETGERYYLKLFRDYVFHQVDHDGRAVLDLGHIVTSLNKLDAGIDEKLQLVSRDEQNVFVVSFREIKRGFESAWAELSKSNSTRR